MGERIDYVKGLNEMLTDKYTMGRKLGAGVIARWIKKPVMKCFKKWKLTSEDNRIEDLEKTLKEKMESVKRLEEINNTLEGQNNNLLGENEDLRQSSIDGLEIANVIIERITTIIGYTTNDSGKRAAQH